MATVLKRVGPTGNISFLANVRIKGFDPARRTFKVNPDPSVPRAKALKAARADAEQWAKKLELELRSQLVANSGVRHDVAKLTIAGLIRDYLKDPKTTEQRTYKDTERLLGWWINHYGGDKVLDFGVRAAHDARDKLRAEHNAPATTNRYLSTMRRTWNWGREAALIPVERPWAPGLMLREPRGRIRFLSDEEIGRLLKAAEPDAVMRAAIVVSIATGLRQGELLRLEWKDLKLDQQTLTVHESKNGERRTVHLPAEAVEALRGLKKRSVVSQTNVFFIDSGRALRKSLLEARWKRIRKAAKLKDFRWHDLRHTCASVLVQSGSTLAQVGSVLGHKSPGMTMRYSHLVEGAPVPGHDKLGEKLRGRP